MPDNLRIAVDELRKRMEPDEEFVFIDTRDLSAWAQSDVRPPGAIRVPLDNLDENLSKIPNGEPILAYRTLPKDRTLVPVWRKIFGSAGTRMFAICGAMRACRQSQKRKRPSQKHRARWTQSCDWALETPDWLRLRKIAIYRTPHNAPQPV